MKKITFVLLAVIMIMILAPSHASSKPIWLKFKIGLFAKWSINGDDNCFDGWGICITWPSNPTTEPNYIGYDRDVDKFYIRIAENYSQAKYFSNDSYELKEDSPVHTKLIAEMTNFTLKGKYVILKKGTYKILREGGFYIIAVDYYQK